MRPGPLGGDRRSGRIEAVAPLVLETPGQTRDATIDELRRTLVRVGTGSVTTRCAASSAATASRAKKAYAAEQDRPDLLSRR